MLNRRTANVVSVMTASLLAVTPPAEAGCLCDWLFGRRPAYAAAAIPVAPPAYSANFVAPAAPAASYSLPTTVAPPTTTVAPTTSYAAQMPAYGAAPAPTGYSSYYGTAAPATSFYGTGNVYPAAAAPVSYAAAYRGQSVVAEPVYRGGLLGWLFGTNYRTRAYPAQVTYYRPQTVLNPATGAANVVQQPCTSTQYQIQRTPYAGLQPATTAPLGGMAPAAACPAPVNGVPNGVPSGAPAYGGTTGGNPDTGTFVPQPTLPPAGGQTSTMPPTQSAPTYETYPSYDRYESSSPTPLEGPPPTTTPLPEDEDEVPMTRPELDDYPSSSSYTPAPKVQSMRPMYPASRNDPPSSYARPIPAPPTTWQDPAAGKRDRDAEREVESFADPRARTAQRRPRWDVKLISWTDDQPAQGQQARQQTRASQSRTSQTRTSQSRARMELNAPRQLPPRRAAPSNVPTTPQRENKKRYDNSGWRSSP